MDETFSVPVNISDRLPRRRHQETITSVSSSLVGGSYSSSLGFMSLKNPAIRIRTRTYSVLDVEEDFGEDNSVFLEEDQEETTDPSDAKPPHSPPSSSTSGSIPNRSLQELVRLSAIGFGLNFCFATETALVTPIFLKIGLPTNMYSFTWFISPILGFLLQPLLGSLSDKCTASWGRRRPFILALCICIIIGLTLLLNGEDIGNAINSSSSIAKIIICLLGVVLLDFSADSTDCPHRSYMLDTVNGSDIDTALNIRALFTGIGGGFGYIVNGINWENTALGQGLGGQNRVVYMFCVTACCVVFPVTLFSIKEVPLAKPGQYKTLREEGREENGGASAPGGQIQTSSDVVRVPAKPAAEGHPGSLSPYSMNSMGGSLSRGRRSFPRRYRLRSSTSSSQVNQDLPEASKPETTIKNQQDARDNQIEVLEVLDEGEPTSIKDLLKSIVKMPPALRRLCINHLFGEISYITLLLFFTDYVGRVVYKGDPTAEVNSDKYAKYNKGVSVGCWGMCIFAFSAAIYSVVLDRLVRYGLAQRTLYVFGQLIFGIGAGLMAIFPNVYVTLAMCSTFGIMFTTIATLPFSILALYHENDQYTKNGERGIGTDTACLACQMFLAQIIISASLGPIISAVGSAIAVVLIASLLAFVASIYSALFVLYDISGTDDSKSDSEQNTASSEHSKSII